MSDQQGRDTSDQGPEIDPSALTASLAEIARRSQDLVTKFLTDQASAPLTNGGPPPMPLIRLISVRRFSK